MKLEEFKSAYENHGHKFEEGFTFAITNSGDSHELLEKLNYLKSIGHIKENINDLLDSKILEYNKYLDNIKGASLMPNVYNYLFSLFTDYIVMIREAKYVYELNINEEVIK